MTNITNYKHPSLLGMNVVDGLFDSFFVDFPRHLKQTTQGYPVADIYSDDDGNSNGVCSSWFQSRGTEYRYQA